MICSLVYGRRNADFTYSFQWTLNKVISFAGYSKAGVGSSVHMFAFTACIDYTVLQDNIVLLNNGLLIIKYLLFLKYYFAVLSFKQGGFICYNCACVNDCARLLVGPSAVQCVCCMPG